ncbi:MAG: hypothetical protein K2X71_10255 [Methylobacterium sp.]|uniref:hypothetical protein n=1 Tax=Methylobacterium sp. TaxID=409 RepID=UPI0025887DFD|nr:hypothetical protein [Methylobacterium sp.]MBY0296407.1 hypothetical protein [Methylobacterium sp.]
MRTFPSRLTADGLLVVPASYPPAATLAAARRRAAIAGWVGFGLTAAFALTCLGSAVRLVWGVL